jgi:hypothetical protein
MELLEGETVREENRRIDGTQSLNQSAVPLKF